MGRVASAYPHRPERGMILAAFAAKASSLPFIFYNTIPGTAVVYYFPERIIDCKIVPAVGIIRHANIRAYMPFPYESYYRCYRYAHVHVYDIVPGNKVHTPASDCSDGAHMTKATQHLALVPTCLLFFFFFYLI